MTVRKATKTAGQLLREELRSPNDAYSTAILIERAAQTADWLEKLDALLDGRRSEWLMLKVNRDQALTVNVDNALREARALSGELRHLLTDIHRRRAAIPTREPDDDLAGL